jgi:hypothetical protein
VLYTPMELYSWLLIEGIEFFVVLKLHMWWRYRRTTAAFTNRRLEKLQTSLTGSM